MLAAGWACRCSYFGAIMPGTGLVLFIVAVLVVPHPSGRGAKALLGTTHSGGGPRYSALYRGASLNNSGGGYGTMNAGPGSRGGDDPANYRTPPRIRTAIRSVSVR